jgi:hypothetical protein
MNNGLQPFNALNCFVKGTRNSNIGDDSKTKLLLWDIRVGFLDIFGFLLCTDSREYCMTMLEENVENVSGYEATTTSQEDSSHVARKVEEQNTTKIPIFRMLKKVDGVMRSFMAID